MEDYLTGDITAQGKKQLLQMLDNAENIDPVMAHSFMNDTYDDDGEEYTAIRNRLHAYLNQKINERKRPLRLLSRYRIAIAACIIGIISITAGYVFFNQKKKTEDAKSAMLKAFTPGKEGAILTLADGRKIILDSMANGTISEQGDVRIQKLGGQIAYTGDTKEAVLNTMTTPKGRQYTLILADGSKVILNAESSIQFPTNFTDSQRVVTITGEVYFEVAKNPFKKFIVRAGNMTTEVLGTHFMVSSYDNDDKQTATLIEGSIKVNHQSNNTYLKPGNQLQVAKSGAVTLIKNANIDEMTGWINGYFYFEKADIRSVMKQLMRWYDIEVVYEKNVTKELFGGKIQRNLPLPEVMDILKTIGVRYKVNGKTITIGS